MAFNETDKLESWLKGEQLFKIEFYNVNENYFVFDPNTLIVDGAVVLDFGVKKLVIGWNEERELLDSTTEPMTTLLGNLEYYKIEDDGQEIANALIGRKIVSSRVKWNWYNEIDENLEFIAGDRYIIEDIVLEFEDGAHIQIATVEYTIEEGRISSPVYSSQGEILVTTKEILEIQTIS